MKLKLFLALSMGTIFSSGLGIASDRPQLTHVVVLFDASSSNPMVTNTDHASRVAHDVVKQIGALSLRDRVTVSTLGEYDVTKNPLRQAEITTKFPPEMALRSIERMIASFPQEVKQLPGGIQEATYILGSLEMMARRVSCGDHKVRIWVLTDGQENGQALGESPGPIFQGCDEMTMVGVLGRTPAETKALGTAWMKWCSAAGFIRCNYLN